MDAARTFVMRVVERYRDRKAIVAWQVEHEAVDPLGVEHSWRLSVSFLAAEIRAVRLVDATRPIVLNGFLTTGLLANLFQWWRTRDQGDSLVVAEQLADIVGIDYYPRYALVSGAGRTLYMNGSRVPWQAKRRAQFVSRLARKDSVSWSPKDKPNPGRRSPRRPTRGMWESIVCLPEHLIETYNQWLSLGALNANPLYAYLFWGAEYWVRRQQSGDASYLNAFTRILET